MNIGLVYSSIVNIEASAYSFYEYKSLIIVVEPINHIISRGLIVFFLNIFLDTS